MKNYMPTNYITQMKQLKYLETHNLAKLNYKEIENMNRSISSKETESEIKYLPTKKSPRPPAFTGKFYQTFRKELTSILLRFFQKTEEQATLSNLFYEASTVLKPKPNGDTMTKLQLDILDEH